jgi:tetratricopeptide (TPR) repeat protein
MSSQIAALLLLVLLTPACASRSRIPLSQLAGWCAAEARGTRLIGDLAPEEMRSLAGDLLRFDAIFAKLAGWPETISTTPLSIYLFRNRAIAERFGLGRGVEGWALDTLDESFITVHISSSWENGDRSTLFHEYTHVLLGRNQRTPLPRWYHEGLASYFSTVYERGGAVIVGAPPAALAARAASGGTFPLERLFAASTAEMRFQEIAGFYATSWALSHYLLSSPSGRRELSAFVKQLARGVPSAEAQKAAFGRSAGRLDQELAVHVAHLNRGVPAETLIEASAFAAPDPPPVVALEPDETAYALASLALATIEMDEAGEWETGPDLARNLLVLARDENASDVRVEAALGEARAVSGDAEGALAAEQVALARAPDDSRVRLHAGRVALLRAEAAGPSGSSPALTEAEKQYRHALALDRESASAWFGLGKTLVRMGRAEEAFAAFQTARRFGWSERLDVALARLHLARGERERAADLLRPIAQDPHRGRTQEEASELLEQGLP